MRILVVNNFFPPRVGGSSHLSEALARGYARSGHEVLVLTAAYGEAPAEEERDGLRIVRLPAWTLPEMRLNVSFDLSFATRPGLRRKVTALLDEFKPDVIHQHGQFMDLTWATGEYARRRDVPTLLSVHTRLENPSAHYRHAFRGLDAVLVKPRLKRYHPAVVVMDSHMQTYIEERYRGAYSELVPIPVGVDPAWVRGGSRERGREMLGLGDDVPVILSVGHVIPLRDRVGLVEAMPAVLARHPEARAGRGRPGLLRAFPATRRGAGRRPRRPQPRHRAQAGRSRTCWPPPTSRATSRAGASAPPPSSRWPPACRWSGGVDADNFPSVPLVDGRDIVLRPVGDVAGLADGLNRLLGDADLDASMGARARAIVDQHFDLARVLEQHEQILARLAGLPLPSSSATHR